MHYTAVVTKEGKQTLAEFPGCPGARRSPIPGRTSLSAPRRRSPVGWRLT